MRFLQKADPSPNSDAPAGIGPKRVLPIHPFLFASFPILALYARNSGEVPIEQLYRPLGVSILVTLAIWALFAGITRHVRKAALVASVAILAFFTYGHLVNLLPQASQGFVAPLLLGFLAIILFVILRSRYALVDATRVLNLASVVLIAPSAWTTGSRLMAASQAGQPSRLRIAATSQPGKTAVPRVVSRRKVAQVASKDLPDVYYIILDCYAREDSLKRVFSYDNSAFVRELQNRGFYVAPRSRANYNQTPLCLASSLNMTYLDSMASQPEDAGIEPCRRMLDDNAVADVLARSGYQYVYIWSGAGQTRVDTADRLLNGPSGMSPLETNALALSAAARQTEARRYAEHREHVLGAYRELNNVARLPSPKFVFAHVISPHPPFVFGPNGEPVDPKGPLNFADGSWLLQQISREEYIRGYIGQLEFVNRRTLEAVDAILQQSSRRPIIIIQADHGSRMNLDWESESKTDMKEPFSILNAYCVPPKVRAHLYDSISPVNSFRILLTDMFGAHYKLLPDHSYYSGAGHPYDFIDVTRLADAPPSSVSSE